MDILGLLNGANGLDAQQNLLGEVRDSIQAVVASFDRMKQYFATETHNNVQVLIASLNEIKQLTERATTLLEQGLIGPRELPYLMEVITHLQAAVDSLQDSSRHRRRAYILR